MNSEDRTGHGWWPYVVPYLTFLLLSEVGARMPDAVDPWLLLLKPGAVLGLFGDEDHAGHLLDRGGKKPSNAVRLPSRCGGQFIERGPVATTQQLHDRL